MSEKSLYIAPSNPKKGIEPFPEWPSVERANMNVPVSASLNEEEARSISATDLFNLFTADVIRENLEFRR